MEVLRTHKAVRDAIAAHEDYPGGIVVHGTPRIVHIGEILEPRICKTPATTMNNGPIDYTKFPPYVFATPAEPDLLDYPVFMATVKAFTLPYTAGTRVEGASLTEGSLTLMASDDVKVAAKRRNHTGTLCVLPAETFGESPKGSWAELASEKAVPVLGAYAVHYTALSLELDSLPPLSIPGVSEEELHTLAAAAREAASPNI